MDRTTAYWTCQIAGWTLYATGSFIVLGLNIDGGFSWTGFVNHFLTGALGILVTHAFRGFAHRAGWTDLSLRALIPRVIGAALGLGVVFVTLGDALALLGLIEVIAQDPDEYWTLSRAALSVFGTALLLGLWLVIYFGVHTFWNYRSAEVDAWKLEAQAKAARLKALKLQLNPHFFFNSLNSVRALIAEDPERAQRMVTRLARLLRSTLQIDDVKTVTLEEELSTVRTYLELETVRFEERLSYRIDASPAALHRPIPFLLVQTLVENSVKHGIAALQDGGTITVTAEITAAAPDESTSVPASNETSPPPGDMLSIRVTNPGSLNPDNTGTGLRNARERLNLLFGESASLTLTETDGRVEAIARLPEKTISSRPGVDTDRPAPPTGSAFDRQNLATESTREPARS